MHGKTQNPLVAMLLMGLLSAFAGTVSADTENPEPQPTQPAPAKPPNSFFKPGAELLTVSPLTNASRQAFFGDLHVHTTYSYDAYIFGTLATPYDAYQYAKGEAIRHPAGFEVKLQQPLDFYAVTDHDMFLGLVGAAADPTTAFSKLAISQPLHNMNAPEHLNAESFTQRIQTFITFLPAAFMEMLGGGVNAKLADDIARSAWHDIIKAAEQHNDPGTFTTFIAYEYTTTSDDGGNLHRNVIFRDNDRIPDLPFSRYNSQSPEGLWDWMDNLRKQGIESLAIPHNSNGSNGNMFQQVNWAGEPMDSHYANQRLRNEPLVEITQVKGTSDTHPAQSMTDEWADFEIMPYRVGTTLPSEPDGSYVRQAYRRGLSMEDNGISNPYKFGLIGSSDTHTGAASNDESNYFAKLGLMDATAALRGSVPASAEQSQAMQASQEEIEALQVSPEEREARHDPVDDDTSADQDTYITGSNETFGASGLAGVWAEQNTRDAIYSALRRKETFATTGPRIQVRLFAGYSFNDDLLAQGDWLTTAYGSGVAMGSDLPARADHAPGFLVWAARDPNNAPLQRIQVIKAYTEAGEHFETIYDVGCSDGLAVDPATHRCPDNGATVDLSDCSISKDVGDTELKTLWRDPDFKAGQRAMYYVRVLENPTCRWSTWDALRAGVAPRPGLQKTIQERAWSSPIWYIPADQ